MREVADLLADSKVATRADLLRLMRNEPWLRGNGVPAGRAEGFLFPDTYQFERTSGAKEVMLRLIRRHQEVFSALMEAKEVVATPGRTLGWGSFELVTLASIVEKETGLASERAAIAGVFTRRLALGMKLQTDPTVIYGLGEHFDGDLTRADLQGDTPYNTYIHEGLPPTPIALPGREAIHSVMHPLEGGSLYFVAKGDGSHHFSSTLAEHNRAVREYQLRRQ